MKLKIDDLGVVGIIVDDWSFEKAFKPKTIVTDYLSWKTYISRRAVPKHIELENTYYWKPILKPYGYAEKVQSDWNQKDETQPDYIKNKPSIGKGLSSNDYTDNDKSKLTNLPTQQLLYALFERKQNVLTFDSLPTANSLNPVISSGIKDAIDSEKEARVVADSEIGSLINSINSNLNTNYYNKEEINSVVARTPETDVIVVDIPSEDQDDIAGWLDANTPSGTDPETGKSVRANKIYRVPGPTNTTFSEWAWDGEAYIMLDEKEYGIDDEPNEDSNNPISSKAIANLFKTVEGSGEFYLTDKTGAVVLMLSKEQVFNIFENVKLYGALEVESIKSNRLELEDGNVITQKEIDELNDALYVVSEDGSIIFGIDKNKKLFGIANDKTVYDLNIHKDALLHTASKYGCSKDTLTQIMVCTDTHENKEAFERFVQAVNDFESVSCGIFLGDCINYQVTYESNTMEWFASLIEKSNKPIFFVAGNHDVGHAHKAIPCCASDKQLYDWFIKPNVDNLNLKNSEYINEKLYYCHEFDDGTLLIVLNQYDDGNVIASQTSQNIEAIDYVHWTVTEYDSSYDTYSSSNTYTKNDKVNMPGFTEMSFVSIINNNIGNAPIQSVQDKVYWKPITYSSSYPNIITYSGSGNTSQVYVVGDKVNIKNFTEYSFECIEDVEVKAMIPYHSHGRLQTEDYNHYPKYKATRSWLWYGYEQLIWFCHKLEYAAQKGLKVIIATHMPYTSNGTEIVTSPFSQGREISYGHYSYRYNFNNCDVIAEIVNAWVNKTDTPTINLYPLTSIVNFNLVDTIDDVSSIQGFDFSYSFRNMETPEGFVMKRPFFIGGHVHIGGIFTHKDFGVKQLIQDCASTYNYEEYSNNGVGKSLNINNICYDRLNVLTIFDSSVHITRLGSDYVNRIKDDELMCRNNVVINF